MLNRPRYNLLNCILFALCTSHLVTAEVNADSALPELKVKGSALVDPTGATVILKGCNLGNWLLLEPWMFGESKQYRDQHTILSILKKRFGHDRAEQLMDIYRENWITSREFNIIKSFGFNVVRVPFHYKLLVSDNNPLELRKDAFQWLDRAIELAEQAGVYVILDLHGTPGGQSADMTTGRVDQNRLWTDPVAQASTLHIWQSVAKRYRDHSCVVAYDMINEPWGTWGTDIRKELVRMMDRIYNTIRDVDPDTLILAAGSKRGIFCYGDPQKRHWTNAGFTDHFYPGMFGTGDPLLATHLDFLSYTVPEIQRLISGYNAPYLIGEFNVVFDYCAQPEMMRLYYDTFSRNGWHSTLWSLRIINPRGGVDPDNWYLATNARPFTLPDLRTASYEKIAEAFRTLGTMKLAVDEELRDAIKADDAASTIALPRDTFWQTLYSETAPPAPWKLDSIGHDRKGRIAFTTEGSIQMAGFGKDIWNKSDELVYLNQKAPAEFLVRTTISKFSAPNRLSKAGWMLRESTKPNSAHVLVHVFEDGRVMLGWRSRTGNKTEEHCLSITGFPVGIGISRDASGLYAHFTDIDGIWKRASIPSIDGLSHDWLLGLAVNSHDNYAMAHVMFEGIELPSDSTYKPNRARKNLLKNGSFETALNSDRPDRAADWHHWGELTNRHDTWTPTRDGRCLIGYHHWQVKSTKDSGFYQDITGLTPGKRYAFSIDVTRDRTSRTSSGPDTIELRIESNDGNRVLRSASHTWKAEDISTSDAWSRLQVTGIAPTDNLRVLVKVQPGSDNMREGALKFDNATLLKMEAH